MNSVKKLLRRLKKEPCYPGKKIKRVRDIPSNKELDELSRTNQAEFDRVYRESMKVLTRANARVSIIAIIIGGIAISLSLIRLLQ